MVMGSPGEAGGEWHQGPSALRPAGLLTRGFMVGGERSTLVPHDLQLRVLPTKGRCYSS